jgi:manganese transport protein
MSWWKRMFAFAGPAYLVSVGYMDPGNWATDLEGGARFGYSLLWVLVLSNLMAILLQTLSARLGIVSQRDLAQACREAYPRPVSYLLWILCEIAIAACDLAEVLGAAIALNLLFHIPLLTGVLITAADTLLILWLTKVGIRLIEGIVLTLILTIGGCFALEIWLAGLKAVPIFLGLIPHLDDKRLYVAIGILGATVMPHNLYLHSALVQTRRLGKTAKEKATACRFNFLDSAIALNAALLVNAAILILAASVFFTRGIVVTQIQQAQSLLSPLLGTGLASVVFAIALLCSGQSSTLTGTMAGQIVMEGFLNLRMRPWLRRLITRMLAVIPAAFTIYFAGDGATYSLIILSQVILSLQLPFAIIPLIQFTSSRQRMGQFANAAWVQILSWVTAIVILGLNIWLVKETVVDWVANAGPYRVPLILGLTLALSSLGLLMAWITVVPWIPALRERFGKPSITLPSEVAQELPIPEYRRILVPLDHSSRDRQAIIHAAALAKPRNATLYLLHVEEGVTSQVYGSLASTAEVEAGSAYLEDIVGRLERQGIRVELAVRHSDDPSSEIVHFARQIRPDLVVMGAHGHKGLKDIFFGATINAVRHQLKVPLLIVGSEM